jgi:hypothetical protein
MIEEIRGNPSDPDRNAVDRALGDPARFGAPPDTWAAIERRLEARRAGPSRFIPVFLAAAAAAALAVALRPRLARRPAPAAPRLVEAALRIHRERLAGELGFELCDRSSERVRRWVCAESGLDSPSAASRSAVGADECAAIVDAAGAPAAVLAWERASGPVTVVTARVSDLGIETAAGWAAGRTYRDPGSGITLLAWSRSDQAFVLASGGSSARR